LGTLKSLDDLVCPLQQRLRDREPERPGGLDSYTSRSLRRQVLESDTVPAPERLSRRGYSPQELGMVLQPVVEPVVLAFEADQHASRLPVPSDEDVFGLAFTFASLK